MAEAKRLYPEGAKSPWELQFEAAEKFIRYSRLIQKGGQLIFPWQSVHQIVGPLLPGWLVLVGARGKGGKSTLLRAMFDSWIQDFGKRIMYVGTEQDDGILRALWACLRLRVPQQAAFDPEHPEHQNVLYDVKEGQAKDGLCDRAIIVAQQDITVDDLIGWGRMAYREKCDVLMFDHFHRLEDEGESQHRGRNSAIRNIKNMASKSNMLVVVAAQLTHGEGGHLLGQYEVPGASSWAETAGLRRECDVAIQAWRPFVQGVTRAQKAEARDDGMKLASIVQENVMAIRCDAHRYPRPDMEPYRAARLYVNEGELTSWSSR